jgi:hypothetical protein
MMALIEAGGNPWPRRHKANGLGNWIDSPLPTDDDASSSSSSLLGCCQLVFLRPSLCPSGLILATSPRFPLIIHSLIPYRFWLFFVFWDLAAGKKKKVTSRYNGEICVM